MTAAERESGFTLVEVLVAFTMVALVLTAGVKATSAGLRQVRAAEDVRLATMHAQGLLARIGADLDLVPGESIGATDDGTEWSLAVLPRAETGFYDVTVRTSRNGRSVVLDTIRIAAE